MLNSCQIHLLVKAFKLHVFLIEECRLDDVGECCDATQMTYQTTKGLLCLQFAKVLWYYCASFNELDSLMDDFNFKSIVACSQPSLEEFLGLRLCCAFGGRGKFGVSREEIHDVLQSFTYLSSKSVGVSLTAGVFG